MANITVKTDGNCSYVVITAPNQGEAEIYEFNYIFLKAKDGYVLHNKIQETHTSWDDGESFTNTLRLDRVSQHSDESWADSGVTPPDGYEFFTMTSMRRADYTITVSTVSANFASDPTNGGSFYEVYYDDLTDVNYIYYSIKTNNGFSLVNVTCSASGITPEKYKSEYSYGATYTAHFKSTDEYTVYFDGNGAPNPNPITVTLNKPYGTLPTPVWENHVFLGWYTSIYGDTKVTSDTIVTTASDHTLYALWEDRVSVVVTYDVNGGNPVSPTYKIVYVGDKYGTLPTPTRDGHTFLGWFYDTEKITSDTIVTINTAHTITARWRDDSELLTVEVSVKTEYEPLGKSPLHEAAKLNISYTKQDGTFVTETFSPPTATIEIKTGSSVTVSCDKDQFGGERFYAWGDMNYIGVETGSSNEIWEFNPVSYNLSYTFTPEAYVTSLCGLYKIWHVAYCKTDDGSGNYDKSIIDPAYVTMHMLCPHSSAINDAIPNTSFPNPPSINSDQDRIVYGKFLYYYNTEIILHADKTFTDIMKVFSHWESPTGEKFYDTDLRLSYKESYGSQDGSKFFVAHYVDLEKKTIYFDDITGLNLCDPYTGEVAYYGNPPTFTSLQELKCKEGSNNGRMRKFLGWYTDPIGGTKVSVGDEIGDITTLYAHWESMIRIVCTPKDGYLDNLGVKCALFGKESTSSAYKQLTAFSKSIDYLTDSSISTPLFSVTSTNNVKVDFEVQMWDPNNPEYVPRKGVFANRESVTIGNFFYWDRKTETTIITNNVVSDLYVFVRYGVHTNLPIRKDGIIMRSVAQGKVMRDS